MEKPDRKASHVTVAAWNSRITIEELEVSGFGKVDILDGKATHFNSSSVEFENYV